MRTAAEVLRESRTRAGLSQAELGRKAGVTQSVISAYESGARQPSVPMLARLVEATGSDLQLRVMDPPGVGKAPMLPGERFRLLRSEIREVLGRHGLRNARVFGSVVHGHDGPESDVDLLVDVPDGVGLLALGRCQAELEGLLGVPVDLVPCVGLKGPLAAHILAEAVVI
jgi:predicted nucleotidyltransferase/DNA-binding XRE family transcriptional regulator